VAGALLAALAVPACGVSNLNFVRDDRLTITAPKEDAEVKLPLTVRWTVDDFTVTGPGADVRPDAGYFGVFVDREPPRPGATLASLATGDPVCDATPGCPDAGYLAGLRAYTTTATSFEVARLPELTVDRDREAHEVTIVLLDGSGHRIGESAFRVQFHVRTSRP
jgi:hypothetical protein